MVEAAYLIGFGRNVRMEKEKNFLVTVRSSSVRDTQIAFRNNADDQEGEHWRNAKGEHALCVVTAKDKEQAVTDASNVWFIEKRNLKAYELSGKETQYPRSGGKDNGENIE